MIEFLAWLAFLIITWRSVEGYQREKRKKNE